MRDILGTQDDLPLPIVEPDDETIAKEIEEEELDVDDEDDEDDEDDDDFDDEDDEVVDDE